MIHWLMVLICIVSCALCREVPTQPKIDYGGWKVLPSASRSATSWEMLPKERRDGATALQLQKDHGEDARNDSSTFIQQHKVPSNVSENSNHTNKQQLYKIHQSSPYKVQESATEKSLLRDNFQDNVVKTNHFQKDSKISIPIIGKNLGNRTRVVNIFITIKNSKAVLARAQSQKTFLLDLAQSDDHNKTADSDSDKSATSSALTSVKNISNTANVIGKLPHQVLKRRRRPIKIIRIVPVPPTHLIPPRYEPGRHEHDPLTSQGSEHSFSSTFPEVHLTTTSVEATTPWQVSLTTEKPHVLPEFMVPPPPGPQLAYHDFDTQGSETQWTQVQQIWPTISDVLEVPGEFASSTYSDFRLDPSPSNFQVTHVKPESIKGVRNNNVGPLGVPLVKATRKPRPPAKYPRPKAPQTQQQPPPLKDNSPSQNQNPKPEASINRPQIASQDPFPKFGQNSMFKDMHLLDNPFSEIFKGADFNKPAPGFEERGHRNVRVANGDAQLRPVRHGHSNRPTNSHSGQQFNLLNHHVGKDEQSKKTGNFVSGSNVHDKTAPSSSLRPPPIIFNKFKPIIPSSPLPDRLPADQHTSGSSGGPTGDNFPQHPLSREQLISLISLTTPVPLHEMISFTTLTPPQHHTMPPPPEENSFQNHRNFSRDSQVSAARVIPSSILLPPSFNARLPNLPSNNEIATRLIPPLGLKQDFATIFNSLPDVLNQFNFTIQSELRNNFPVPAVSNQIPINVPSIGNIRGKELHAGVLPLQYESPVEVIYPPLNSK